MCAPMLVGVPPPKFPKNQPVEDESQIHTWNTDMKYYSKYLIYLCVPWLDESVPLFGRSAKGFCLLVNAWNNKSSTFIKHQRFPFLSNFMSKWHRSSHKKTAATSWRQGNVDWWSEMKKAKQNTSPSAEMATAMGKVTDMDDKAAGQLSSTDLHCIIMAAMEGKNKQ